MGINHSRAVANCILDACNKSTGHQISLTHLDTPVFREHLGNLLCNLMSVELSESLQAVLNNYTPRSISQPQLLEWHSIQTEKWIDEQSAIWNSVPSGPSESPQNDRVVHQLYQGLSIKDPVMKRICALQFSDLVEALSKRFYDKGKKNPISRFIKDPKRKPPEIARFCTDSAFTGRRLKILKAGHPALLLISAKNNNDFETVLPTQEDELKAVVSQVSSMEESRKYGEAVNTVCSLIEKKWKEWLRVLSDDATQMCQGENPTKKRKKDGRLPIELALATQKELTQTTALQPMFDDFMGLWNNEVDHEFLEFGATLGLIECQDQSTYLMGI